MDLYNTRMICFGNDTFQIRRYSQPIVSNLFTEEEKDLKRERYLWEKDRRLRERIELQQRNPFTDELTDIWEYDEESFSAEELERRKKKSIHNSLARTKNALVELSRSERWEWFLTFTFNDSVNRFDFDECSSVLRKWFNNMRSRYSPDIKYLVVPELHKSGAWHFHGFVSNLGDIKLSVAKNQKIDSPYYGDDLRVSYPDGDYIYNVSGFKRGFTTATEIIDSKRAANYILKYITKDLVELSKGKRRYFHSNGLTKAIKYISAMDDEDFSELLESLEKDGYKIIHQKETVIDEDGYQNRIVYYEIEFQE